MKIIDYKIIRSSYQDLLEEEVNKSIKEGWQPFGGVSHTNTASVQTSAPYNLAQAMVKYESN